MDPYAAVVPTLGDSSTHGMHMSTFMVTAHTEDVSFWLDSEPMSGYSIDNLHPSVPMGLALVQVLVQFHSTGQVRLRRTSTILISTGKTF